LLEPYEKRCLPISILDPGFLSERLPHPFDRSGGTVYSLSPTPWIIGRDEHIHSLADAQLA
jgi:hypothetical protein